MKLFTTTTRRSIGLLLFGVVALIQVYSATAVAPTIDYSHNMRILKLPKSLRPGELVYRLKGSDGDPSTQLHFGVGGAEGRALLDVHQVPGSWNEADVFLRGALMNSASGDESQALGAQLSGESNLPIFNLTIFVSDGNKSTQVESTLIVTNDDELEAYELEGSLVTLAGNRSNELKSSYLQSQGTTTLAERFATSKTNVTTTSGLQQQQSANVNANSQRASSQLLSPFIRPRHVFSVSEAAGVGETIGWLSVRESDKSDLPVRFELRGKGADHFAIRYVFGPRGQSRGELLLAQPVDYERQNLFNLKVLALNAWTNTRYDTRNVATLDVVITVGDVQDTAPQWRELPTAGLRIPNTARPGDQVGRVRAEDGDFGDQRPVQYALDASSQLALSNYFSIEVKTGVIQLTRPVNELALILQEPLVAASSSTKLVVFASELPDTSSFEHLWPPMFARAELPLMLVDEINEAPRFLGGWQAPISTSAAGTSASVNQQQAATSVLHGYLRELPGEENEIANHEQGGLNSATSGHLVQWYVNASASNDQLPANAMDEVGGRPMAVDLNVGLNGTFELSLEGPDAHLFELEPNYPVQRRSLFNLMVAQRANRTLFDADAHELGVGNNAQDQTTTPRVFQVDVVARDFGQPKRLSARIRCLIELLDSNDNAPQFEEDLYTFQVYENAPPGQVLGSVRARDLDAKTAGSGLLTTRNQLGSSSQRVRYVSLTGFGAHLFKLDQVSGLVTLAGQLDRERQATYLLVAEARDSTSSPLAPANYTKIMINVLDVNDNAPVFSQTHYEAVLQPDGSFHQPLVVSARDLDEPQSANSQVAYEIIAGNQNDQFSIDALSGVIYPTSMGPPALGQAGELGGFNSGHVDNQRQHHGSNLPLPPILSEPILPFGSGRAPRPQLDQSGRIRPPAHEVEETTAPPNSLRNTNALPYVSRLSSNGGGGRLTEGPRAQWSRQMETADVGAGATPSLASAPEAPLSFGLEQLPSAFDLFLNSADAESSNGGATGARHVARSVATGSSATTTTSTTQQPLESAPAYHGHAPTPYGSHAHGNPPPQTGQFDPLKVAPLTQLVVRAHDFGIPLRSSTCKVSIYNQALVSRSLSVILNGTSEQLEQRRELIERSLGALTASKVQIESIDALSDSSSICVARLKLTIPASHSLIDLTDLTALMQALDYKPAAAHLAQNEQHHQLQFATPGTHYIAAGDRLYPVTSGSSNLSASGGGATTTTTNQQHQPAFYTDLNQLTLDSNLLERKLLFYIIIVGICILALLVIWMIYFCCRETEHREVSAAAAQRHRSKARLRSSRDESSAGAADDENSHAASNNNKLRAGRAHYKQKSVSKTHLIEETDELDEVGQTTLNAQGAANTQAKTMAGSQSAIGKNLAKQQAQGQASYNLTSSSNQLAAPSNANGKLTSSDHYSMYNGQVWFEQGGLRVQRPLGPGSRAPSAGGSLFGERRASSAPSASGANDSLDSSLRAVIRRQEVAGGSMLSPAGSAIMMHPLAGGGAQRGRFFPNTIGYMENLASIKGDQTAIKRGAHRGGKVAPMSLALNGQAMEQMGGNKQHDLESGAGGGLVLVPASSLAVANELRRAHQAQTNTSGRSQRKHHASKNADGDSLSSSRSLSCTSRSSGSTTNTRTLGADSHESVLLDSDQELLGFDSSGTPIIATHTRRSSGGGGLTTVAQRSQLLSELTGSSGGGANSPAPTVIQAGAKRKDEKVAGKGEILVKRPEVEVGAAGGATGRLDSTAAAKKVIENETATRILAEKNTKVVDSAKTSANAIGDENRNASEQQQQMKTTSETNRKQEEEVTCRRVSVKSPTSPTRDGAAAEKETKGKTQTATAQRGAEKSLDLMGELNERLASNNQKRALRRQSADEREPQQEQTGSPGFLPPLAGASERVATSAASGAEKQRELAQSSKTRRASATSSLSCQSSISSAETTIGATPSTSGGGGTNEGLKGATLRDMKNGELLEKQSIFALTYSGLATDKLPS